MSVTSANLPALSAIAGFDTTSLFNAGFFGLSDHPGPFGSGDPITDGINIAAAVQSAGVNPQNGIKLIEAVAQDNGVSTATLITALLAFARFLPSGYTPSVAQSVATEIAGFVQAGTLTAATAVADIAAAALNVAGGGNVNAYSVGQQLAVMLGQLAGSLGSDPVVAAINTINPLIAGQSLTSQLDLLLGLASANPASVVTGLKGLLGSSAASLSSADLALSAPTAGTDIANAVFAANGAASANDVWQGIALIQALALAASVSPVTALVYYEYRLSVLTVNDANNDSIGFYAASAIGSEITRGLVVNSAAIADVTSAVIAIAASGSTANAAAIGVNFDDILSNIKAQGVRGSHFDPYPGASAQVNTAIANGVLTADQGFALLAGAYSWTFNSVWASDVQSLINSGAVNEPHALLVLAVADGFQLAHTLITNAGSTFAQTVPTIDAAVQAGTLTGLQAVNFLGGLGQQFDLFGSVPATNTDLTTLAGEVVSLISQGHVAASDAFNALVSLYKFTPNLNGLLFDAIGATTNLTIQAAAIVAAATQLQITASTIVSAQSNGQITVPTAVELLAVLPNGAGAQQIFNYVNNGNIAASDAVADIAAGLAAIAATPQQVVAVLADVASQYVFAINFGQSSSTPNPALMTAAAQRILALAEQNSWAPAQLAAGFASAYATDGLPANAATAGEIAQGYVIGVLEDLGSLSDPHAQPLATGAIADLTYTSGAATTAQPLSPQTAAVDTGGNLALLFAVAGQLKNGAFDFYAGQAGANAANFASTLSAAVTAGTINTVDAALVLGSLASQTPASQLAAFVTQLAGYATGNANVISGFGAGVGAGYDPYVAISALALIGGTAPSLQQSAQNEIITILQAAGGNNIGIGLLPQTAQIVASAPAFAGQQAALNAIASDIAAIVANNFATATSAAASIGPNVASANLNGSAVSQLAANAITLLEYLATYDTAYRATGGAAGLEAAAQSEIALILGSHDISVAAAVTTIQGLQATVAAGTPLYTVIGNELLNIESNPVAMEAAAAVGSVTAHQLQSQAVIIAGFGDPFTTQKTDAATASGKTLNFASLPAGVAPGEVVLDLTNPAAIVVNTTVASIGANNTVTLSGNIGSTVANGDTIGFYNPLDQATANAATGLQDVLNFASVPAAGWQGLLAVDFTNPSAIPAATTVASFTGTTVTLSGNLAANVASGDEVNFYNLTSTVYQVGAATTNATTTSGTAFSNVLNFSSLPASIAPGDVVQDILNPSALLDNTIVTSVSGNTLTLSQNVASAVPSGTTIEFVSPFSGLFTNAATPFQATLNFPSVPADVEPGQFVVDFSNPGAVPAGTTVASVTAATVTLSGGISAPVANSDVIGFFQLGEENVLQAMVANLAGGSVSGINAVALLIDLANVGAPAPNNPALTDATNTLVSIATNGTGGLTIPGVIAQVSTALANGSLAGSAGLRIFESFIASGTAVAPYAQAAIASGLVAGYFTIAQIDVAVTAGTIQPLDAIAALSRAAGGIANATQPAVTVSALASEIQALLAASPSLSTGASLSSVVSVLATLSTPSLLGAALNSDYTAVNTLIAADSALVPGFFSAILGVIATYSVGFPNILSGAESELFGNNGLVTTGIVSVNTALVAIQNSPAAQQLQLLVLLAGVPNAQSAVLSYVDNIVSNPGNTNTFITVKSSIEAFAAAFGGTSSLTSFYEELLTLLGQNGSGAASFVTDLENSAATSAQQLAILSNLVAVYNQVTPSADISALLNAFTSQVGSLLLAEAGSPSALASSLGALYTNGIFTRGQVMKTPVNLFLGPGSPQAFLTEVADLSPTYLDATTVVQGVIDAQTSGAIQGEQWIEALVAIGTGSAAALQSAAITALATTIQSGAAIATNAMSNIGSMVGLGIAGAGPVVTLLTQLSVAQSSLSSAVVGEIQAVVSGGSIGALDAATAMALAAHGTTLAQQSQIAGEIASLFGSGGAPDLQSGAILAAAGTSASALTPAEAIAVLAAFAAQGRSALQFAAGAAIAGLVHGGAIAANTAADAIYGTLTVFGGATTPAQMNEMALGLLATGQPAAAAHLIVDLLGQRETMSDVATVTSAAVGGQIVTALQIVDLAAAIAPQIATPANAALLIGPLLASGALTGQAAVQELGSLIGTAAGNLSPVQFMAMVAALAAGSSTAVQTSIGTGLAAAIGSAELTYTQVATGLALAVAGNPAQNIAPVLTAGQAVAMLIGAAASGLTLPAGNTIGSLAAGNSTLASTVAGAIENAVAGGVLTPAQALSLLAGIVGGGAPAVASAAAAAMYQAGQVTSVDFSHLLDAATGGTVPQGPAAYILASAYPAAVVIGGIAPSTIALYLSDLISGGSFTVTLSGSGSIGQNEIGMLGGVSPSLIGQPISGPGVPPGATVGSVQANNIFLSGGATLTAAPNGSSTFVVGNNPGAVEAQIVAALPPGSALPNLIALLVGLGPSAGPVALGQTLLSIIESGAAAASDVIAQIEAIAQSNGAFDPAPLFALGSLMQAAATAPTGSAVAPATIESAIVGALSATYASSPQGAFVTVANAFETLAAQGGLSKAVFLPVLAQLLAGDTADYLSAVAGAFHSLLDANAATSGDLVAALTGAGVTGAAAIVALAAATGIVVVPNGAGAIAAPITPQNQLFGAIAGIAAGQSAQAVIAAFQNSGLPAGQVVAGLAALYPGPTIDGAAAVVAAIASLVSSGAIAETAVYTILGQSYQAIGFADNLNPSLNPLPPLPLLFARIGGALGDTATSLAAQVAQGSYGSGDATVDILVRLAGADPDAPKVDGTSAYPRIGLNIGATILGLVNSSGPTLAQALSDILAIPGYQANTPDAGVSDNNKMLVMLGMAGAGSAAQQVAIGAALGSFFNGGAQPDLKTGVSLVPPDAATLLLAGMVTTASPSIATVVGGEFALLLATPYGVLPFSELASVLEGAVGSGALTAAGAVDTLGVIAGAAGDQADIRGAIDGILANLVGGAQIALAGAVAALATQAGLGSARLQAETGALLGSLTPSGTATPAALVSAIDAAVAAQSLTAAQAIVFDTGAALGGSGALATALGSDIGAMIAGTQIGVGAALAAVQAGDTAIGVTDGTNEVLLLLGIAGASANGLQYAAGQAIGGLLNRAVVGVDATIAALDGAVGDLSAAQAGPVLIGVAQTAGFQAQVATAGEFARLIAANQLTATAVVGDVDQAIRASNLSATAGFAVLLSLASNNTALTGAVATEIAGLIPAIVTADQALAALFAGAGAQDFSFVPAATDGTLAAIVTALVSQNAVTVAQVAADLGAAATGTPTISAKHAVGVLLDLRADTADPAAGAAYANALSLLATGPAGIAALGQTLLALVAAGTMTADQAVAILAAAASAASAAQAASLEATIGPTLATLVNNGSLTAAGLIADLRAAVTGGALGVAGEIGLLAGTAAALASPASGVPLAAELIRLVESTAASAAQLFADIEAVAAAAAGSYDHGVGLLTANIATTSDPALQAAVAGELASLIARNVITGTQAASYIATAVAGGLAGDTAVLLLSTGITSPTIAGAGIAALVNNGNLTAAQLITDLRAAVTGGALGVASEIGLLAGTAAALASPASGVPLAAELIRLVESTAVSAAQLFAGIEAVAAAAAGGYDHGIGLLIANIATTSDPALQAAVAGELASLIARNVITGTQAASYIAAAVAGGLAGDGAVLLLSTGIAAPTVAGAGIAALVNNGQPTLAGALGDLQSAVSSGALSVDSEIELIAGMANHLTVSGSLNTLSARLVQLVETNAVTASQVFADIASVAQLAGSYSPPLAALVAGMAGTSDAALQTAVGQQLGSLVGQASISPAAAVTAVAAALSAGQVTNAQAQSSLLAFAANGGPAIQAAVGQFFGGLLNSQNDPAAVANLPAAISSAAAAGRLTASQQAELFVGLGTAAYGAPAGGSAATAGLAAAFIVSGGMTLSAALNALSQLAGLDASQQFAAVYIQRNSEALAGTTTAAASLVNFENDVYGLVNFHDGNVLHTTVIVDGFPAGSFAGIQQLATALGGFGVNTGLTQFLALIANRTINAVDAFAILTSFADTGALIGATGLAALVAGGHLTAAQAMAAADAVAPFVDPTRLIDFLASLAASPSMQAAMVQEVAALVAAGRITATAAAADIASTINAAPAGGSAVAAISPATAVAALLGIYGNTQSAPLSAAAAQQLASLMAAPPAGYSQTALVGAVDSAVSTGAIGSAAATQLLFNMAAAAQLAPDSAVLTAIAKDIRAYIGAGALNNAAVVADAVAASTSTTATIDAGTLIGDVEGVSQAITDIAAAGTAQTITAGQEALMLLSLFPGTMALPSGTATTLQNDLVGLVTSGAVSAQTLIADVQAFGQLSASQYLALFSELAQKEPSTLAAAGAAVAGAVSQSLSDSFFGQTDAFFTGAAAEAGSDLIQMNNGTMTVDQAIGDIEQYAITHNVSIDGGLTTLSLLPQVSSTETTDLETALLARATDGALSANLAAGVALGDLTEQSATDFLRPDYALAGGTLNDLTEQQVEALLGQVAPGDPVFVPWVQTAFEEDLTDAQATVKAANAGQAHLFAGLSAPPSVVPLAQLKQILGTVTEGFYTDETFVADIDALSSVPGPAAAADVLGAVTGLANDLTTGYAETSIINMLQSGQLGSWQEAVHALNDLLAPVLAYDSGNPSDQEFVKAISYGWLTTKASEFIAGNYQISTGAGGQETITVTPSPVDDLFAHLASDSEYQNLVMEGLGAVAAANHTGMASAADSNAAFSVAQTIATALAKAVPLPQLQQDSSSGGILATLGHDISNAAPQVLSAIGSDLSSANTAIANGIAAPLSSFEKGWELFGSSTANATPGSWTSVGHTFYQDNGQNSRDYVDLASKIGGRYISNDLIASLAGDEAVPELAAIQLEAELDVALLNNSAVAGALGPAAPVLAAEAETVSQLSSLLGEVVTVEIETAVNLDINAGTNIGNTFGDLESGNFSKFKSDAAAAGDSLITVASGGFSPADLGATGGDAGQFMQDLLDGDTANLKQDAANLGLSVLKLINDNAYMQAMEGVMESFGEKEDAALQAASDAVNNELGGLLFSPPTPPPPPPQLPKIKLPNGQFVQIFNSGGEGQIYQDPSNQSNYGTFYHGAAIDGYIANATVSVEIDGTVIYKTTTDASGNYALPQGIAGTIVITGGTDIATGLPLAGTLTAPSGSTAVTALTTLVQAIAAGNGNNVTAAIQQVDAALGLDSSVDPTQTNPILSTQAGSSSGAQLFAATSQVQNTLTLINAAGGSNSTAALAQAITALPSGTTLNLTDPSTLTTIATNAGVDPTTATATATVAGASNNAVQQQAANTTDPTALLTNITAVSIATQGNAATQLSQSVGNPTALDNTVSDFTGSNLTSQVSNAITQVGNFSAVTLSPANGDLGVGQTVEVTLNVIDPVAVNLTNGTPTLALNDGGVATYDAGKSTATALAFDYTVHAGDNTAELETAAGGVSLNGATITDLVTSSAVNLSGAASAAPTGVLVIDTTPPAAPPAPALAASSALGAPSSDIANSAEPTFTGTAELGSTVTLFAGGVIVGSGVAGANGYSIASTVRLAAGSYTFAVTATDAAGNASSPSAGVTVAIPGSVPTATSPASVATFAANRTALDQIAGGFAITDTAANIGSFASLASLAADASNITTITATDTQVVIGVGRFSPYQAILDKIVGGFTFLGQAPAIQSNIDAIEADIGHINSITALNGSVAVSLATLGNDQTALNEIVGGFAISDTAADIFYGLGSLEADVANITTITATDTPVAVGIGKFLPDETALNKIAGGFGILGQAPAIQSNIDAIEADIGHINSITALNGAVAVSLATLGNDQTALNEIVGGFAISDTAADIFYGLGSLEADVANITTITATDTPVAVGIGKFLPDETALNKIAGGFGILGQAPAIQSNIDAIEADIGHINSITALNGTVAVSLATLGNDQTALNKIVGGFAISDTAADIFNGLASLEADVAHITAITATDVPVAVGIGKLLPDETALNKIAGGFDILGLSSNIGANFDALEADASQINSLAFADVSTPVLNLTQTQASNDASLLAKIISPYVLNVANQDGSTATTGHGSPLTIMAVPGGDDIITGGGPSESFVFGEAFGKDTVTDFYSHLSNDTISLPSAEFANFGAVMSDASFSGGATIITASNGDKLILPQLTQAAFQGASADFKFI